MEQDGAEHDISQARIERKLGTELYRRRHESVRALIAARGGSSANINETGQYADFTLHDTAYDALNGSKEAGKAVKIVKQAKRLGQKY